MSYLLKYFIKRLPREGFKSLSVPFLALALVFLINVMGGVKARMEDELEYTIDNHTIYIEISDGDGIAVDGLLIGELYIKQLTDPEALWSLYDYVDDVLLKRELDIVGDEEQPIYADLIGVDNTSHLGLFGEWFTSSENMRYGILSVNSYSYDENMRVELFEEYERYGESLFHVYENACLLSEDLLGMVDDNGDLHIVVVVPRGQFVRIYDYYLTVAGTVSGPASRVYTSIPITATIMNTGVSGPKPAYLISDGIIRYYNSDNERIMQKNFRYWYAYLMPEISVIGSVIGCSAPEAYDGLNPENGAVIEYYDGYDVTLFSTDEYICLVSEDVLNWAEDDVLSLDVKSKTGVPSNTNVELTIAGVVYGAGEGLVFTSFEVASQLGVEASGQPLYSESMSARLIDNNDLVDFKQTAMRTFKDVGVFFNDQVFSMTIYDSEFYNITEALMQTIFFIDFATPFVYAIAVSVGFIASYLLIRRRKAEFANMRSLGVNKVNIFFGALFEQTVYCAIGAILGCALFMLTWNNAFIWRSLIFVGCYALGAVFSAASAAGTDVLKLLRAKE